MTMMAELMTQQSHQTGTAVQVANTAAVTTVAVSWTNWLPPTLSAIATMMTIIWIAVQMTITIRTYMEKRELARGPRGIPGPPGPASPTILPVVPVVLHADETGLK